MSILTINKSKFATDIFFEDRRELSVPLEWFPKLKKATLPQLKKWRFIGNGEGIHWKDLDEDISSENLLINNC